MSKPCSIYKNTFFGDLYPFVIDGSNIIFETDNGRVTETISNNINLSSYAVDPQPYWKLAILSNDSLVYNKAILGKTQVHTKVLGIENAIAFKPHFRHWTLSNTDKKMSCNWFISSMFGGMEPEYGAMFWYKQLPLEYIPWDSLSPNTSAYVTKDVFSGSNKLLNKGSVVTKLSDNIVYDRSKSTFNLSSNPNTFNNKAAYVDIGPVVDKNTIFSLSNNDIIVKDQKIDLWLSRGEALSYYNNSTEKDRYNQSNISSYSYLSPGLFSRYREIYHSLTKRRPKGFAYNRRLSHALQKLCYFLSTGPFFDRTTTDILANQDVYNLMQEYISKDVPDTSTEINSLLKIIHTISEKYLNLSQNANIQHITTYSQLTHEVLNKYAAVLAIGNGESLSVAYKENISNHIIVSLGSINTFKKGESADTVLYNNSSIRAGDIECASNFSDTVSAMKLNLYNVNNSISKSISIPLADKAIPAVTVKDIFAGGVISKAWNTSNNPYSSIVNIPEMILDEKIWEDAGASLYEQGASYIWEHYGGESCIKFRDYSKDLNSFGRPMYPPIRRFNTSINADPTLFLRKSGTYELKVTRTLYRNISQSDIVIITTDNNTEITNAAFRPKTYIFNKNLCSSFKITAFNQYGMVWLVDTDNYYDQGSGTESDDYLIYGVVRLTDIKLNLQPGDKLNLKINKGNKFILNFKGGTAGFWLMAVEIEHMRDESSSHTECKSFYREKVARLTRNTKLILGSADFGRISTNSYTFSARNCGDTENFKDITFNDPQPSTCFSPVLYSYGGYTKEQIDTIGIHMPFHPSPDPGSLCKKNLPLLPARNPFQEIADKDRYCFPEEVFYSKSSNITLSPGHFRPDIGWTNHQDLIGKTAVVSDMPNKQECFTFKGGGFYSLRPGGTYSSNIYLLPNNEASSDRINNQYGVGGVNSFSYSNYSSRVFNQGGYDPWFNSSFMDEINSSNICGSQIVSYGIPPSLSDAVIENVEIKLNFLNYFNPKNLKVWLTCPGAKLSDTVPDNYVYNSKIDVSTEPMSSAFGILSYIDRLNSMHTNQIVLMNQEHIDNYQNNFSITFSDNADKFKTLSKSSYPTVSDEFQKIIYHNHICNNNDKILASLKVDASTDIDSDFNAYTAKIHNYNSTASSKPTIYRFSALKGKPLNNMKFTLNIQLMDHLINDGRLFDNLSYNDQMAGNTTTENINTSNVSLNSLCSWEVIVYVKDIKNPVSYNYTNGVDYGLINNKTYQPYTGYDYLMDLGPNSLTRPTILVPLVNLNAPYPSIASVNRCSYNEETLGKSVFTPRAEFPSLIPYLTAGLGFGFGSIVGGMVALSALNHFLGNGGRNDPIINYFIESRLLNQTETTNGAYYKPVYDTKYFGQADRAVICLSNQGAVWHAIEVPIFRYINTPAMLPVVYKYIRLEKNNLGQLSNLEFKPISDIQDIDFAIKPGSSLDNYFLHYNTHLKPIQYLDISDPRTESDLKKQTYIILDGYRPFKLFSMKEPIYVSTIDKRSEIVNMALVLTNTGVKTILELSDQITAAGYISKDGRADTILLYKENLTSIMDESRYFGKWSANSSARELSGLDTSPLQNLSAYSPGSIGWGTSQVKPEMLYSLEHNTSNLPLIDLVNNSNDKIIQNSLYISSDTSLDPLVLSRDTSPSSSGLIGWSTTLDDLGYIFHKDGVPISTGIHTFADKSSPVFVELKCDGFKNETVPATGYIRIENHWTNNELINVFLIQQDLLKNQLMQLNKTISEKVVEYNEMQEDAAECFGTQPKVKCPKIALKNSISDLISQRLTLLNTLEKSTLNNVGYYTLPYGQTDVNKDRYKDWYWISINPEQPSILVDELTVKLPQKLEMIALPIVGDRVDASQLLPNYYAKVDGSQPNAIKYFQSGNGSYTYTTPSAVLEQQKQLLLSQYPGLTWSQDETFVYGTTDVGLGDSKKLLIGLGESARDNLIGFKETYIRPYGISALDNKKIKDVINLGSPLKAKFRNMPRQLQTIDSEDFDKYVYDKKGNIAKGTGTNARARSVGQLANNFVCWKCIDKQGVLVDPPPFFKILNEMHYRAFFGSADKVEHKSEFMDSQFAWEWIPYEFFPGECKVSGGQWDNPSLSVKNIMSLSGDVLMIAKTIITRTGSEIKFKTFDLDLAVGDLIGRVIPVDGFCNNIFSVPPPPEFDLNRIVKCITTQMLPAETRIVEKEEEIVNNQPSAPTTIQYVSEIYKIELGDETNSSSTDFEFDDVGNCVEYTDTATITTNFMGSATAHRAHSIGALCAGSGQSVKISYASLPQDTVVMLTGKATPGCECVSMVFSEVASGDGTATVLIPNGASSVSLKVNSGDQRPTFSDSTLVEAECIK